MSHAINGAEIFAVGTHNGLSFTEADLDAIVKSFTDLQKASRVPLKLGHDRGVPDGQPAMGWVERIWRDGKKLFADFTDIPKLLFEAIGKRQYKQVSIELLKNYSQSGATFPWVLDAVALLGADIPAVKGLSDLKALQMASALPGVRFASRAAFTSDSNFKVETFRMSDDTEELKKLRADLAAANERAEKVEKERFTEKVEARRKFIRETLETAVKESRILPNVRDRVLNSRQFKADADVLEYWSEEAIKAEISGNQRHDFKEKPAGKGATSMAGNDKEQDFSGKTNAEVATFKTREECLAVGGKPDNFDDLNAAQARVFKEDPKLARAYFSDPRGTYAADAA